ncbi:MAG: rhodanese-like domain-containing protein [Austwickia sp.]|nr:rhodanese-like domain-containing protein [Austwickia sp.]MCO5309073.1 rhodanese-like domain-containing protein [Austwickia sp.]
MTVSHQSRTSAALSVTLALALAGCAGSGGSPTPSSPPGPTVRTAGTAAAAAEPANGAAVDVATFAEAMTRPGTIILDVRTPEEFAAGHLQGARNLDLAGDFAAGLARLDKSASYAVYCRSGNRSGQALATMHAAGFQHAYHLAGGTVAWQQAGRPLVTT